MELAESRRQHARRTSGNRNPFDQSRVDRLMEEAELDVLIATSKHNVQYLLGGYKFIFFSAMDAIGHSRYLPVVIYEKGRPDHAAYIGNRLESGRAPEPSVLDAGGAHLLLGHGGRRHPRRRASRQDRQVRRRGSASSPVSCPRTPISLLRKSLPEARVFDATSTFERMRALKTPAELEQLRTASELITDSMLATIAGAHEGSSKTEIIERLRREETNRGLQFEYCLLTLGASHNRAASPQTWAKGEVLSIDSGGNYHGYIGDLCRMGVLGEPDAELDDLLAEIEAIQQAAFSKVRAGTLGGDVIAHAEAALKASPSAAFTDFFAHGMGLIAHEVPFLMTNHPVAYEGVDAEPAAGSEHGHLGRDDDAASVARLHQARGYAGDHRQRLRDVRRHRPRLEPRRHSRSQPMLARAWSENRFPLLLTRSSARDRR